MKIKILVEDKKQNRYAVIPLSRAECKALYNLAFMLGDIWDDIELNGMAKEIKQLNSKWLHLVNDILDRGITYSTASSSPGRPLKFKKNPEGSFYFKKPRWIQRK